EARDRARDHLRVEDALGGRLVEGDGGRLQRDGRGILVLRVERRADALDEGTDRAGEGAVAALALDSLAVALLGGRMIGHGQFPRRMAPFRGKGPRTLLARARKSRPPPGGGRALQRAGRPTQAPAQARPHAIGEKARANTTATGAANPSSTSVRTIASPDARAGSNMVGRFEARAMR